MEELSAFMAFFFLYWPAPNPDACPYSVNVQTFPAPFLANMAMASSFPYAHSARPMEYTFTRQAGHNLGVLSFDKAHDNDQ